MKDKFEIIKQQPLKLTRDMVKDVLFKAYNDIEHYVITLVLQESGVNASGVLVNVAGYDGILTAYHVAESVMHEKATGLCFAKYSHALYLNPQGCTHVPIGFKELTKDGPDLSFIIINDKKCLSGLKRIKSFHFLDNKNLSFFDSPKDSMIWVLSGSPVERAKPLEVKLQSHEIFLGECFFESYFEKGEFDYFTFGFPSGVRTYPNNCKGMSGGGAWLVPLIWEEKKQFLSYHLPLLAGIPFWQVDPIDNVRIVTAHGWKSVYLKLRETLAHLGK